MRAVTFTIELLQPMLATGLEGDPNAGVSLPYIPGSVLRGVIIGLYLRKRGRRELDLTDEERKLFFSGAICYLNAYPLVESVTDKVNERTLPVPLSWQKEKDANERALIIPLSRQREKDRDKEEGAKVFDFCFAERSKDTQYKNLSGPFFIFLNESTIRPVKVETRLAVHTQRNPRKGRAISDDGEVFRYESIAAGAKFTGAIISTDKALLIKIKDEWLKDIETSLGGSRTGGYGRVKVADVSDVQDDWRESQVKKAEAIGKEKEFTVTLLSNALVRDKHGQPQADLAATFEDVAGVIADKTFKSAEIIGGFNRKWGLPLPQMVSLKAGSVFTFKAKQEISLSTVQQWLDEGIGERRLDGFGRIAVNLNRKQVKEFSSGRLKPDKPPEVALQSADEIRMGSTIAKRIMRQRLEAKLVDQAGMYEIEKAPRNSQISRLRLVLREALQSRKLDPVNGFFGDLKKTAREQFETATVLTSDKKPHGNLRNWVEKILRDQSLFDEPSVLLGNDAGKVEVGSGEFRLEYHLRLIDSVLAFAAKQGD